MENSGEEEKRKIFKYSFFLACAVLMGFILWSVVTETLIPLYKSKAYDEFIYNLFGIPLIILGTCVFAYGGWLFFRDTTDLMRNNYRVAVNLDIIKTGGLPPDLVKAARSENTKFLLSAWKKGALFLLIGAVTIVLGGLLINFKNIIG